MTDTITHFQASGKFNASEAAWHHLLTACSGGATADIGTLTEAGFADKALRSWAKANKYDLVHSTERGKSEVAVLVNTRTSRVGEVRYRRLTKKVLRVGRKAPLYALEVQIEDIATGFTYWVSTTHLPAHIERPNGVAKTWQGVVFRAALRGWGTYWRKNHTVPVIVTGDWNLNLRKKWVQKSLQGSFPHLAPGFNLHNLPKRGTHGPRIIDGPRSNLVIASHGVVLDHISGFDHAPVRTKFRLAA